EVRIVRSGGPLLYRYPKPGLEVVTKGPFRTTSHHFWHDCPLIVLRIKETTELNKCSRARNTKTTNTKASKTKTSKAKNIQSNTHTVTSSTLFPLMIVFIFQILVIILLLTFFTDLHIFLCSHPYHLL